MLAHSRTRRRRSESKLTARGWRACNEPPRCLIAVSRYPDIMQCVGMWF